MKPIEKSFDLGPRGFVVDARFVLAQGDWQGALSYANAAASLDPSHIAFGDVQTFVNDLQKEAKTWSGATYPQTVVALADPVVAYATKTGTYLPALAKVLGQLGDDPKNAQLKKEVDAIVQVLSEAPGPQAEAAGAAAKTVTTFENGVAGREKKLRPLFEDYTTLYLGGRGGGQSPTLPSGLDAPVSDLGKAWSTLQQALAELATWVAEQVQDGRHFEADLSADAAVQAWTTAGDAANRWRQGAYQG